MEETTKAVKLMPLNCAKQALAGGLGSIASPVTANVGNIIITISQEGAIATADQEQEEGEGGVDRDEDEDNDHLQYSQDDDKNDDDANDFKGEVGIPIGKTPKCFSVQL